MKRLKLIYAATLICAVSTFSGAPAAARVGRVSRTISRQAKPNDKSLRDLRDRVERLAAAAKGRVGVAATILEVGETISLKLDERFPMQSVYKFPIGMAALRQIDDGKISLTQKVRFDKSDFVRPGMHSPVRDANPDGAEMSVAELLRFAVSESDGTASDVLLELIGGAGVVDRYLKELNVDGVVVANSEKEIGRDWETQYRNWATPAGALALLRALHEGRGLSAQSRALLLKLMTETPTGLKRLKGLLPAGTVVAHKTGTSGSAKGVTAATNDIGIITLPNGKHLAVAVFVADAAADAATREEVIAKVARAIYDEMIR